MTTKASTILDRRHSPTADDLTFREQFKQSVEVAELVLKARTDAGLTQRELADRVGTSQSVIARLEDADYEGHSLSMLRRVAAAVNSRVELRFVSNTPDAPGEPLSA